MSRTEWAIKVNEVVALALKLGLQIEVFCGRECDIKIKEEHE